MRGAWSVIAVLVAGGMLAAANDGARDRARRAARPARRAEGGAVGTAGTGGTGAAGTTGIGGGGMAGTGGGAEPGGLIAHWRFNEGSGTTVADSSGNGQTLTLSTTGASWIRVGHEGARLTFDGAAGFAGDDADRPASRSQLPGHQADVLGLGEAGRDRGLARRSRPRSRARTRTTRSRISGSGSTNGKPGCTHSQPQTGWAPSRAPPRPPARGRTSRARTRWTGEVILYVNGAYAAAASSNQTLGPIPPRILVGADEVIRHGTVVLQHFFPGAIDDVRIYRETLTASEVPSIAR